MIFIQKGHAFKLRITTVFLLTFLFSNQATATEISPQIGFVPWFKYPATVVNIRSISGIPRVDENWVVEISGMWRDNCIPIMHDRYLDFVYTGRYPYRYFEHSVSPADPENCSHEYNPTPFRFSVTFTPKTWQSFVQTEEALFEIGFVIAHGTLVKSGWIQFFDMKYGLHEIPPRLESGYWVSDELPYQAMTIQQQDDVTVFFKQDYDRVSGEPNWIYADARFYGNTSNGVAHTFQWLNPTEDKSVQPSEDELISEPLSAGIKVLGYNQIEAFVGMTSEDGSPPSHTYKRYVFTAGNTQLPPVIPDMAGQWNLYGFNQQKLEQSYPIEFRTGNRVEGNLYRFTSIDDQWVLDCEINLAGEGGCSLINEFDHLSLSFDMLEFNGNYAKSDLVTSGVVQVVQTGILLRSEFHLPVLDLQ